MTDKVRVGIIGCGRILPMHITPATVLPQAELVAVCDVKKDRADAAAKKYGCRAYADYREMLDKEHLDAVHLCTPHYLHPVLARYAFERGVHVLSEKPMAIDYADAEACVSAAKERGVLYGVILQCRYNTASQFVKKTLESGKLGRILSARSTLTWLRPDDYYAESDWKGTWDKEGGGVVIDQAIHSMDLVNWFIGEKIARVSASIANRGHAVVKVEDSAEGLITYESGIRYGFWCMNNYACDEPIEIRLLCERGKVYLTYDDANVCYFDGRRDYVKQESDGVKYENAKDYWGFRHIRQIGQFYDAVLGREPLEITGEEALKTQRLVNAVYESGRTGRTIEF